MKNVWLRTLAVALFVSGQLFSQTSAGVNGVVLDSSGGLIADAAIATVASRQDHGYRGDSDCFEKQTTRWNSYGERVTGYTTICR